MAIYGHEHAPSVHEAERIGYAMSALLPFWGSLPVSSVKGETCRRYRKSRVQARGDGTIIAIADSTVRRELNVLQAAINYCHREGYLTDQVKVTLPAKSPPRDRWLTRDEAAALLWAAYRSPKGKHLVRFILVALYTGTRKEAILALRFMRNTTGGWVDTHHGVIYRRGVGQVETNKRRKPMLLPKRLLAHLRRWEATGDRWVVSDRGQRVADIKKAFASACERADLTDVTPHTLKHTAITWAMQKGMTREVAADYFDTSVETITRTYYHHSPDYQVDAAAFIDSREIVRPHRLKPNQPPSTVSKSGVNRG